MAARTLGCAERLDIELREVPVNAEGKVDVDAHAMPTPQIVAVLATPANVPLEGILPVSYEEGVLPGHPCAGRAGGTPRPG